MTASAATLEEAAGNATRAIEALEAWFATGHGSDQAATALPEYQ